MTAACVVAVAAAIGCGGPVDDFADASRRSAEVPLEITAAVFQDAAAADPEAHAAAGDWTYWRGPLYNGHSLVTGLPDNWNPKGGPGSNVAWKREDLGSRSSPVAMNGKVYLLCRAEPETPREGERVVCLDAKTGETLWEQRFNVWLSDVPDTRVGWSSVVADPETNSVYALGVCGFFQCLDAETGQPKWSHPLHEKFGLLSTYGGRTNFPIICDDLVIISGIIIGWGDMARPGHRFIGFDKRSGEVVWFNGTRPLPYDTTYSAPSLAVVNGQKVLVFGSGDGAVWAFQPRTGRPLWQYKFSRRGLNVSPVVVGDRVFSGHSEENISGNRMGAVVAIDASKSGDVTESGELWFIDQMMVGKSSPIEIDGKLYCFTDGGKLFVFNTTDGKPVGKRIAVGRVMRASPLYADGKIYAFAQSNWAILAPDDERGAVILKKGRMPSGEECHASPMAYAGSLYMNTTGGLYCIRDDAKQPGLIKPPQLPRETPVAEDQQPVHLQVVPAEALLHPGDKTKFTARLFNAKGQFLKETEAEFSLEGLGELSDAEYVASGDPSLHHAATVTARAEGLTGTARIRVVAELPWSFDFEGLEDAPVTWAGARYRHVVRKSDGNYQLVKITTIPKGTRSRSWMGYPELSNYIIQADVKGARQNNKMPDIGLIAQGYTMDLQGEHQKLEIRTWVTQRRMAKEIPFQWDPDKWYTMKFAATVVEENGKQKAKLYGKVWPSDEDEPSAWMLTAEDESPNVNGSPGLYGNAKDAEISLDNIKVYPY